MVKSLDGEINRPPVRIPWRTSAFSALADKPSSVTARIGVSAAHRFSGNGGNSSTGTACSHAFLTEMTSFPDDQLSASNCGTAGWLGLTEALRAPSRERNLLKSRHECL